MGKKTTKDSSSKTKSTSKKKPSQTSKNKKTTDSKKKKQAILEIEKLKQQNMKPTSNPFRKIPLTIINLKERKKDSLPYNNAVVKLNRPCKSVSFKEPEFMHFRTSIKKPMMYSPPPLHMEDMFENNFSSFAKLLKPVPEKCNCGDISPSDLKMISMLLSSRI